jgi:hypothetical protein
MPLDLGFGQGKWHDAGKMAGCLLVLPVIMFGPIAFARVEVDEEEIRLKILRKEDVTWLLSLPQLKIRR